MQLIGRPRQPGAVAAALPDAVVGVLQSNDVGRQLLAASKLEALVGPRETAVFKRIDEHNRNSESGDSIVSFKVSPQAVVMAAQAADDPTFDKMYALLMAYNSDRFSFMAALAVCAPETILGNSIVEQTLRRIIVDRIMPGARAYNVPFPWTGLPDTIGNSRLGATLALLDYVVALQDLPVPADRALALVAIADTMRSQEQLIALSKDTLEMAEYTLNYTVPYTLFRAEPTDINTRLVKLADIVTAVGRLVAGLSGTPFPLSTSAAWHLLARMMFASDSVSVGDDSSRLRLYVATMQATDPTKFGRTIPKAFRVADAKKKGASKASKGAKGTDSAGRSTGAPKRAKAAADSSDVEKQFSAKLLQIISDQMFAAAYKQVIGGQRDETLFPFSADSFAGASDWELVFSGGSMFARAQHLMLRLAYLYPDETFAALSTLKPPTDVVSATQRFQTVAVCLIGSRGTDVTGDAAWAMVSAMFNALPVFRAPAIVNSLVSEHWIDGNVATLAEYIASVSDQIRRSTRAVAVLGLLTKFLLRYQATGDTNELTDGTTGSFAILLRTFVAPLFTTQLDAGILLANIGWLFGVESLRTFAPGAVGMHKLYMVDLEPWTGDAAVPARLEVIYSVLVGFVMQCISVIERAANVSFPQTLVFAAFVRDAIAMLAPAATNMSMQSISTSKLLDGQPTYPLVTVFSALFLYYSKPSAAATADLAQHAELAQRAAMVNSVLHDRSGAAVSSLQAHYSELVRA